MKWKKEISFWHGDMENKFYPMESNLHFFLAYVGRSYKYTDRAKALGEDNFSTHRVSVGFIWQMPVFSSCFPFLFILHCVTSSWR